MYRLKVLVQSMMNAESQNSIKILETSCFLWLSPCRQHMVFTERVCWPELVTFGFQIFQSFFWKHFIIFLIIIISPVCASAGKEIAGLCIRILLFLEAKVLGNIFYSDGKGISYIPPKKVITYLYLALMAFSFLAWHCRWAGKTACALLMENRFSLHFFSLGFHAHRLFSVPLDFYL